MSETTNKFSLVRSKRFLNKLKHFPKQDMLFKRKELSPGPKAKQKK